VNFGRFFGKKYAQTIERYFSEKDEPSAKINLPNGGFSPNLIALQYVEFSQHKAVVNRAGKNPNFR
jgi:hypothetical protein